MDFGELKKIQVPVVRDIVMRAKLEKKAMTFVSDDQEFHIRDYLNLLIENKLWADAIRLFGFLLPIREGIWWCCVVLRDQEEGIAHCTSDQIKALEGAEAWVFKPSEDKRKAMFALSELAENDTSFGCLALAVFWSGGTMDPQGKVDIPPNSDLSPNMIGASVLLASLLQDPKGSDDKYEKLVKMAVSIANGGSGTIDGKNEQ